MEHVLEGLFCTEIFDILMGSIMNILGCDPMFTDIRPLLDQEEVLELLSYSIYPDPDRLRQAVNEYRTNSSLRLYGLTDDGELLGIIGYAIRENEQIQILHLAVRPDVRYSGYGRGMILEVIGTENPARLFAETDADAADFYRNVGFTVESLGESYPEVERFRCTYIVNES